MTGSKKIIVKGAEIEITTNTYPGMIDIIITVDLSPSDVDEPDHSPHQLYNYLRGGQYLPQYKSGQSYWWCKFTRKITVKSASQARRIIHAAIPKIEDAVHRATMDRKIRKAEGASILA